MDNLIAERCKRIDSSGIRKVFALAAKMEDPVNFSIGQPDFDVPEELKQAAIDAIQKGHNHYSQTAGDSELIAKIRSRMQTDIGWDNAGVMVTSGVSGGILLSLMATINPGDEVILPDPYFVIYKHVINMLGGKCVYVDTYPDFKLHPERIEAAVTEKTKMIIVNSPCNPTGIVYDSDELKAVADIAAKSEAVILSDKIYGTFCYDGECDNIARYYDRTILLGGFSKAYSMTGWRLGFAVVSEALKPVLEQMIMIQQYTFVCAPTPFQKAAIAALDYDISGYVDEYRVKRDLLYDGLKDKFEIARPNGAFYAFVKAPSGSGSEFVKKAIENNLLIIPGNVFSEQDTHFRISYAASNEDIEKGVKILNRIMNS
jgi:aspartate aminotransferase/aminotransferase